MEPAIRDARFPPMVLQPLCDALLRPALAAGAPMRLRMAAARSADAIRLDLAVEPPHERVATERLNKIRRTLTAMFAPHARIEPAGSARGATGVFLEIPYVAAPGSDR